MVKQQDSEKLRHLDEEWMELIKTAKNYGLTLTEIRCFLDHFKYVPNQNRITFWYV